MWTINNFPIHGMLLGRSTAGCLACPHCIGDGTTYQLQHGRKPCWFECHCRFLDADHPYCRNVINFTERRMESNPPPPSLTSRQVWEIVYQLPKVHETGHIGVLLGFGSTHNWNKQSIFWDLPYWKDHAICHNLDVMHIEHNVFDDIFYTILDVKDRTKDNIKAWQDLIEYCR